MEKAKPYNKGMNRELMQVLFNIVLIGIFTIVENYMLFYYGSWILSAIFGFLKTLMCCLLAINIYGCAMSVLNTKEKNALDNDKQVQALLYKQMKKMEAQVPQDFYEGTDQRLKELDKRLEELKSNQLYSTKAVMNQVEQLKAMQEELKEMLQQTTE